MEAPLNIQVSTTRNFCVLADQEKQLFYCVIRRVKQKFSFIKQGEKGWITTMKDSESWHFEH